MHLPYIIFYDIGVLDKKIFFRKISMQNKKQKKTPNFLSQMIILYIFQWTYTNLASPTHGCPIHIAGNRIWRKTYWIYPTWGSFHAQIPDLWAKRICIHSELSPLERRCVPSFWHTGFFFTKRCFVPSLIEISWRVLKIYKKCK